MNNPPAFPMSNTEASMYASCLEDLENPNLDKAEQANLSAKANALCGMTLRDYFAAKAMQGMLANPKLEKQILLVGKSWIEESAWKVADAMLKTRSE